MAGTCVCGYAPSGSIKCGEFLDWLRTGQLLKKDSAPWRKLPIEFIKHFVLHFVFGSFCNGIANREYWS